MLVLNLIAHLKPPSERARRQPDDIGNPMDAEVP
jgi:hypothetical protein